ncbi:proteophosphoglycan ppg4 [Diplodia corticola]|uniref:Proteophosphoglycan ppg4 n=1 Tax=Diplodia corticola TaxID=236234 RepID=A0A1J9QWP3_9PEZI|nr:proteophosphoglycan ppg4 [Diplodia corticola]OJD32840.1 proteophosphoglycan ppg4 [Diplodia corticola]
MSFLNSVLSSIGGGAGQSQSQSGRAAPSQAPVTKPTQTPRVGGPSNGVSSTTAPKRKAEGEPASVPAKAVRRDLDPSRSNPVSRTSTASPVVKPATPASSSSMPYRGTAQPSGSAVARKPTTYASVAKSGPSTNAAAAKPVPKPVTKPAPAVSAAPAASGPAPKKGSYQEILARAKAAQQEKPPVGAIKHKPLEKLTKKEKLALQEKNKQAAAAAKDPKLALKQGLKPGLKGPAKGVDAKAGEAVKEKKKAPDLGYQGTMRGTMRPAAKEPAYQGTMHKGAAAARRPGLDRGDRSRSGSLGPRPMEKRYRYYEDDDEEEEENYDSEGSSDMEAGIFDVDQEEQMSLRVARKEDEEALREEEALKRKKLERKQMLERMNSQAKKKRAY